MNIKPQPSQAPFALGTWAFRLLRLLRPIDPDPAIYPWEEVARHFVAKS